MMVVLEVEVSIRKGLGPETVHRNFPVCFDDLPEETSRAEINSMAKAEVEAHLRSSEDYPLYGKNWTIVDYHYC